MNMLSSTKIHIVSDLFLHYSERAEDQNCLPDADLVIINGNIGHMKRNMFYAETVCKRYPDTQFVYNLGDSELYLSITKWVGEVEQSLRVRKDNNATWPSNLHWPETPETITCRNGAQFSVLATYGFPRIDTYNGDWNQSRWHRYYVSEYYHFLDKDPTGKWFKPSGTSAVDHGHVPIFATQDWINEQHGLEQNKIQDWRNAAADRRILVTSMNHHSDTRFEQQPVQSYDIDFTDDIWIASDTAAEGVEFQGAKLYANPGRYGRDLIFTV